jgi:hypothetical protein
LSPGAPRREDPSARRGLAPLSTGAVPDGSGAAEYDFLASFVGARHVFLSIYRHYEGRVLRAARAAGVSREALVLPPEELFALFHLGRMAELRDARLAPLRDLAQRLFGESTGESGDDELLDVYCSHVYHEFTILTEEHRSVGRFLRIHDDRRYRQLFEEVSGYYPTRLRRIRRLFTGGLRRVEALLPEWSRLRVVRRSVYLFGDVLARKAYGRGLEALYERMYPGGGAVQGFLEAGESFHDSGFGPRAVGALERALEAAREAERHRKLEEAEAASAARARELLQALVSASGPA